MIHTTGRAGAAASNQPFRELSRSGPVDKASRSAYDSKDSEMSVTLPARRSLWRLRMCWN